MTVEEEEHGEPLKAKDEKKNPVPPLDKNLLKKALKCRGEGLHNYGHSSNGVGRICTSPKGVKNKGVTKQERREDYGDFFARILYDYCKSEGDPKSTGTHKGGGGRKGRKTKQANDEEEERKPEVSRTYGDKLLTLCRVVPTFANKLGESIHKWN